MFTTAFTKSFGIEHPIVCGGMTAIGTADLISAVIVESGVQIVETAGSNPAPHHATESRPASGGVAW
jgi:nitronate monooxygenase